MTQIATGHHFTFIVCKLTFICSDAKAHEIKIDVKKGIEAKNYDEQVTLHFEH